MKNIKSIFVLLIIFIVSTINAQSSQEKVKINKLVKSTFTVKGMTCQSCVNTVKNVIEKIDGVNKSDVNLETGEATVVYDPSKTNPNSIEGKFNKLPYKVVEKKIAVDKDRKVNKNDR